MSHDTATSRLLDRIPTGRKLVDQTKRPLLVLGLTHPEWGTKYVNHNLTEADVDKVWAFIEDLNHGE